MKANHKKRKNIILFCQRSMKEEELVADKKSIDKMDALKAKKKYAWKEVENAADRNLMIDDVEKDLKNEVDNVEDQLMEVEMLLQDALFTAFGDFKEKTHLINSDLKNKTNDYIKKVLEAAEEFNKEFFTYAMGESVAFIEEFTAK